MTAKFDYVIVGAGIVGSIMARYLGEHGRKVLVLDAGLGTAGEPSHYDAMMSAYYMQLAKVPNSPYPANPYARSPSVLDIGQGVAGIASNAWYVPSPLPTKDRQAQWFGSDYLRMVGGTTLHWLGTCLRMLPADFRMQSTYGRAIDWPISYADLAPDYARAEWEIGVSANVGDQRYLGLEFPSGYDYPMQRIPPSYVDEQMRRATAGMKVKIQGGEYEVGVISTPQGRNSIPNGDYTPRGRVRIVRYDTHPEAGAHGRPGHALEHGEKGNARAYFEHVGERCEGNSSCIPMCPVQAKYNAMKTLAWALRTGNVEVWPQRVVTRVRFGNDGRVAGLDYRPYPDDGGGARALEVSAGEYILAMHSIENAKVMLASYADDPRFGDRSSQLGRNLMDHPFVLTWARASQALGMYRGPSSTSGIETLRDGAFRSKSSAFRIEVGNWGWDLPNGDPYNTTLQLMKGSGSAPPLFGARLRDTLRDELQRQLRLGALIEQLPDPGNQVMISRDWRSPYGEYRPVVQYSLGDYEIEGFRAYREVSNAVFAQVGAADATDWTNPMLPGQPVLDRDGKPVDDLKWMGSGHLVGTHRMGASVDEGVVDSYQRSFQHPNLFLTGGGSMCTIGTSNPTLTIAALAFRTLRHILGHDFDAQLPKSRKQSAHA